MNPAVRTYFRAFLLYFRNLREHQLNWVMSLFRIPISFLLTWYLWKTLFANGGALAPSAGFGGYGETEMLYYYAVIHWIGLCLSGAASDQISHEIRNGTLSLLLARPLRYLPFRFAGFLGHAALGLVLGLLPVFFFLSAKKAVFAALIPSLLLAVCVHFLFEALVASFTFWLERIFGLKHLILTTVNLLGGRVIPVTLFPVGLQWITLLSPLRAVYFAPASLIQGASPLEVFGTQLLWIFILAALLHRIWSKGLAVFEAAL